MIRNIAITGVAIVMATVGLTSMARADDDDWAKAKVFCAMAGKLLAEGKLDEFKADVVKATNGHVPKDLVNIFDVPFQKFFDDGKDIDGPHFLIEKTYGDDIGDFAWYMLSKDGEPIYLECVSMKMAGQWELTNINFDTDYKKADLP